MSSGSQSTPIGLCPGCGHSIDANTVYCPNCGRPNQSVANAVGTPAPETTQGGAYATAPVQAAYADAPPPLPAWADTPTTTGGMASLATGPALTPSQPIRSHKRRNIFTAISALVVVGLIATGAYWAYAAFASRNDNQLARYFPSTTVVFASADLVNAANNNFHINPANLAGDQATALQKATGLDWQNDILSWVGRDIAVGVFPLANAAQGQAITNPGAAVGVTVLIQSRDDNAAKSAIAKINTHLKGQGSTVQQSTYKSFSLYAIGSGASSGMYGSGGGWVIAASNADAAHTVIDRINSGGDSLNDQQAFKDATSNLPSNSFGTYFVNLRQILNTVTPVSAPNGLGSISIPFVETYPVAGGYLAWTDAGERSQLTFNAVRNPNIPNVSGDTTSFASLVPSDALAFAGVGNLGKLVQAFTAQVGTAATGSDPLLSGLGISASDPLAQQAAGLATLNTSNGVQPIFYVHVNDDNSATQLVNKIASARHWTAKPITIAGQSATALYETAEDLGTPPSGGATSATARVAAIALTLNHTLVIAPDTNSATLVAQVAQGSVSNLTSNATFQKMIKAAPSGAAATGFVNAAGLESLTHASTAASANLFSHLDALAFTLVWNNSVLQGTVDTGLHS